MRQPSARPKPIPVVPFAESRAGADPRPPLGVEMMALSAMIARESAAHLSAPQRATFHCLLLVTKGPGGHLLDFVHHPLRRGDVLHMAAGQVQQFTLDPRLDGQLLVFEADFVGWSPASWSGPRTPRGSRKRTVDDLFGLIGAESRRFDGSPGARSLLRSLLAALLFALDEPRYLSTASKADESLLSRFRSELEASFSEAREVLAYAAALDCSSRSLGRACQRALGKSAKQVIEERILLEAKRQLAHGGLPALEISASLGFAEPTQFGKFFRRLTGETPGSFRARFGKSLRVTTTR